MELFLKCDEFISSSYTILLNLKLWCWMHFQNYHVFLEPGGRKLEVYPLWGPPNFHAPPYRNDMDVTSIAQLYILHEN